MCYFVSVGNEYLESDHCYRVHMEKCLLFCSENILSIGGQRLVSVA